MAENLISEFYAVDNRPSENSTSQITPQLPIEVTQSIRGEQLPDTELAEVMQQCEKTPRKRTHGTDSGKFSY